MRIDVPVTGRMVEAGWTETCPIAVERSVVEIGLLAWGGADSAGIMMGTIGMLYGCRGGRWVVVAFTGGESISWVSGAATISVATEMPTTVVEILEEEEKERENLCRKGDNPQCKRKEMRRCRNLYRWRW